MKIKINYPDRDKVTNPFTGSTEYRLVNQTSKINVINLSGLDEPQKLCLAQTGYLPEEYQIKYGVAWNE